MLFIVIEKGIMKLLLLIPVLTALTLSFTSFSQEGEEFEGVISYDVEIDVKDNRLDKEKIEAFYGKKKEYFYKNGNYKWLTKKGNLVFEIYNSELDTNHTITQKVDNDTLYFHNFTTSSDSVIGIDSVAIETICGIKCQGIKFSVANDENNELTRTLFFPIDSLSYPKDYYFNQKGMSNGTIYSFGGAIPLRLILDIKGVPYKITYTATKLKARKLDEKEFQFDGKAPKKYR
ncbi:MAG: hypothetical protein ACJASQ_001071 [Crocinitomicaceae bacterium]|jgi:hypothetical protein